MGRSHIVWGSLLLAGLLAPAGASAHGQLHSFGSGQVPADPDEGVERLAAGSQPTGDTRRQPGKSVLDGLRDDPYLRSAFAGLNNH